MHCARLYEICSQPEQIALARLPKEQFKDARKLIIEAILHTDMVHHFKMVKNISVLYQMHQEVFVANASLSPSEIA